MRRNVIVVFAAGALALALAAPAQAAIFNVNSTADEPDANPIPADPCATAGGACTLRAAITQANADNSDTTINLPAGTYTLTGASGDDGNTSGDLDVVSRGFQVTLAGAGARATVIDGDRVDRVLHVLIRSDVVVRGVTITGGIADDTLSDGGGIYMDGGSTSTALTVIDSTITGNSADNFFVFGSDGDGGGIHTGEDSQVSISGSTITNNTALDDGGGIENDAASLSIVNSTIHANRALGDAMPGGGEDELGNGGAIEHNEGEMSVVHTTITDNVADNNGGGVNVENETPQQQVAPTATVRSTILSGNQAPDAGPNCRPVAPASLGSAGTNLESGTDCGLAAAGNLQSANPQLGALANNGGQTDTRALGPTSPALHRATTAPCPATDQRGTARPQGAACDIGAFERVLSADLGVAIADSPDPVAPGANVTYGILAGNGGPDVATDARLRVNLPSDTQLESSSIEGSGSCSGDSTLTCALGTLPADGTRRVTVVVKTGSAADASEAEAAQSAGGTLDAVASVSATEADPNSANNEARAQTSLEGEEEAEEEPGAAGGADDAAVAGEGDTGGDLPFTGLPLPALIAAGAWMLGAGLTLRFWIRSG